MNLYEQLIEALPELATKPDAFLNDIKLRNDSDGVGDYIEKWQYSKPIPDGFTVGKPSA